MKIHISIDIDELTASKEDKQPEQEAYMGVYDSDKAETERQEPRYHLGFVPSDVEVKEEGKTC